MLAVDANIHFIPPTSTKMRYLRVPLLLSLLEEGEGCQIDALNDREDRVVVSDENKYIQLLFLGAGTINLHVQCEHVIYAHSSPKIDPSKLTHF